MVILAIGYKSVETASLMLNLGIDTSSPAAHPREGPKQRQEGSKQFLYAKRVTILQETVIYYVLLLIIYSYIIYVFYIYIDYVIFYSSFYVLYI